RAGGPLGGDGTARVVPTGSAGRVSLTGATLSRAVRRIGEPGRGHRADPAGRAAAVATTPSRSIVTTRAAPVRRCPVTTAPLARATAVAASRSPVTWARALRSAAASARARRAAASPTLSTPTAHTTATATPAARSGDAAPRSVRVDAARIGPGLGPGRVVGAPVVGAIVVLLAAQHPGHRRDAGVVVEVHDPDPGRVPALHRDRVDRGADDRARVVDEEDLVVVGHQQAGDDTPTVGVQLVGTHPLAAAALGVELVHVGALAVARVGDGQQADALGDRPGADHPVARSQLHAPNAAGGAAHRPHVGLGEADALAALGDDE